MLFLQDNSENSKEYLSLIVVVFENNKVCNAIQATKSSALFELEFIFSNTPCFLAYNMFDP